MAFFIMQGTTYVRALQAGNALKPTYDFWVDWMDSVNANAPVGVNQGSQWAAEWPRMIVELAFIEGTVGSLTVALSVAACSMIVFTGNVWLTCLSLGMMIFIITAMLAFFVLMGWTLGAVEAVCLSIIVGLSVDYALHLGHAYVHSEFYDRKGRARTV